MYLDIIIHMLYYMYRYKEESVCIVSSLQDNIRKKLNLGKEEGSTKQISLTLNEQTLNKVDAIVEQFKKLTGGKGDIPSSRNQLIEDAIEEYISAAADVLLNDYLVNIEEAMSVEEIDDEELADKPDSNLFFCSASNAGFEEVFLGKNQWYSDRIADWRIPHIKYIACYRGAPYSAVTHYAKVKDIQPYIDGRYIIRFDGQAIPIERSVKLGKSSMNDIRKIGYTSLDKLQQAQEVSDLR